MCHELVKCTGCELVYAVDPPNLLALKTAYQNTAYESSSEASDAAKTYIEFLTKVIKNEKKINALEVGAGNGAFLKELLSAGYQNVVGVEPSMAAIKAADQRVAPFIFHGVFDKKDHACNQFDLICCFMTLEHVINPLNFANDAFNLLKPGGYLAFITHDYSFWFNRFLGKRSPIIDIEHMQLFNESSLRALFFTGGYELIHLSHFKNRYSLSYWFKLLPLPLFIKEYFLQFLKFINISDKKVSINVGNILSVGMKPYIDTTSCLSRVRNLKIKTQGR
jgi:SAM-dependent methyltransferase